MIAKVSKKFVFIFFGILFFNIMGWANDTAVIGQREIPRFASLRSSEVNVRRGPGRQYPNDWIYTFSGLPIKIIAECGTWRKIADHEGAGGWVHQAMLSGRRSIIVTAELGKLYKSSYPDDIQPIAFLEKNVVCQILKCENQRCRVTIENYKGWIDKADIWGIKSDEEKFK